MRTGGETVWETRGRKTTDTCSWNPTWFLHHIPAEFSWRSAADRQTDRQRLYICMSVHSRTDAAPWLTLPKSLLMTITGHSNLQESLHVKPLFLKTFTELLECFISPGVCELVFFFFLFVCWQLPLRLLAPHRRQLSVKPSAETCRWHTCRRWQTTRGHAQGETLLHSAASGQNLHVGPLSLDFFWHTDQKCGTSFLWVLLWRKNVTEPLYSSYKGLLKAFLLKLAIFLKEFWMRNEIWSPFSTLLQNPVIYDMKYVLIVV